ncbi:hypothetical protein GEV33_007020 [Tenebrio molitor]|uniref:Uncharacterized protein n=1 Tax=Tenebrio molitor TaxID=7067 RepID=A0A8J6HKM9_TENMO|nr:hypothetical protein GEV33_007020 [Tenebrio molitor]
MPSGSIALRTKEEDCDDDIAGGKISIDPAVTVSAKDVGKEIGHLEASFIIITHNTAIEYPRSQLNFQNGFNGGLLCVGS